MKNIKLICLVLLCSYTLQSCNVVNFLKKNCSIETQISGKTFFCVTCNFDNASEQLKKRIEKKVPNNINIQPSETR